MIWSKNGLKLTSLRHWGIPIDHEPVFHNSCTEVTDIKGKKKQQKNNNTNVLFLYELQA